MKKYTRAFRLSLYRKMRKYIKDNYHKELCYLCCVLEYDLGSFKENDYEIKDFPELMALKPEKLRPSAAWFPDNYKDNQPHNQHRLDALNKVIEDMTKSHTKKIIVK
jgi:hypothetical protein